MPTAGEGPDQEREPRPAAPEGEVYDWYVRGLDLLGGGSPDAAAALLAHAHASEPDSASIREALARALFDARRYEEAATQFTELIARNPNDDYAQFGLGLCHRRLGRVEESVEHLALAAAMRPDRAAYVDALRDARATLRARRASA
jgi:tetratricopeptide (TPR) repeat protein